MKTQKPQVSGFHLFLHFNISYLWW